MSNAFLRSEYHNFCTFFSNSVLTFLVVIALTILLAKKRNNIYFHFGGGGGISQTLLFLGLQGVMVENIPLHRLYHGRANLYVNYKPICDFIAHLGSICIMKYEF